MGHDPMSNFSDPSLAGSKRKNVSANLGYYSTLLIIGVNDVDETV